MTTAIPEFAPVRMDFPRVRVADVAAAAASATAEVLAAAGLRPGASVAITAGSRGIAEIGVITRAVIDRVRMLGLSPFVVPAMGSHGGATSEGQRAVLARYGITEDTMGCPIRSHMDVVPLGTGDQGVEAFMARAAWDADAVLILNRVKPHTDFLGTRESGLTKMLAIGLGKLEGAQACEPHPRDRKGRGRDRDHRERLPRGREDRRGREHRVPRPRSRTAPRGAPPHGPAPAGRDRRPDL